ncbi:MAG: ECF transporter S component [Candidatus Caldatribacterium sp.]|nr:ECF transporter S component [Candidatus Caldatribacterium sp.]
MRKYFIYAGAFAALSLVLDLFVHFPLIPSASFLLYRPGDIPLLMVSFKFGPGVALGAAAIVAVLFALITGQGGPWGMLMYFLACGTFIGISGWVYRRNRTRQGAFLGLLVGLFVMTGVMVLANLVVTPIYLGVPRSVVLGMILPVIVPFNLLKGAINAVVTLLVYKKVSAFLEGAVPAEAVPRKLE